MKDARFLSAFRDFVFPSACAVCGASADDGREAFEGVCADCARLLSPERGERCPRCGRPLVSEIGICAECRQRDAPSFDGAIALLRYGGAARELLRSYKFGPARTAAPFVARIFAEGLSMLADTRALGEGLFPVVVPVPPRAGKLKEKGWDQMDAVARLLKRDHGFATDHCLRRLPSRSQKSLDRAGRFENMRSVMVCVSSPYERVVLVDDVVTTGATLDACARALKGAGCVSVWALALCWD